MAAFALLLIHLAWAAPAQDRLGVAGFPAPDRPVAGIVSPEYSDEKTRDDHGEAERVMDRLGIQPPQRVADIGAGLGYYTVRIARRLGSGATIYATDVQPEYLDRLRARLARDGIGGVTPILGLPRDPRLPPNSVDVAILSHMYHEIENPLRVPLPTPTLAGSGRAGGHHRHGSADPASRHPTGAPPLRAGRRRLPAGRSRLAGPRRRLPGGVCTTREPAAARRYQALPAVDGRRYFSSL